MNYSISGLFNLALDWLRWRFWLVAIPIGLSIPLSLAAAYLGPKTYVASSLLLTQEASSDMPLARELSTTETPSDKFSAINTLFNSDHTLNAILVDVHGPAILKDPKQLFLARENLRRSVTLSPTGPEFIAVRLRSDNPVGMGKVLGTIISRLLETILSREISAPAAPQFVKQRLAAHLDQVKRQLDAFKSSPYVQTMSKINTLERESLTLDLAQRNSLLDVTRAKLAREGGDDRQGQATFAAQRQNVEAALSNARSAGGTDAALVQQLEERLKQLNAAIELDASNVLLGQEVALLDAALATTGPMPSGQDLVNTRLADLQQAVARGRADLDDWSHRFGSVTATGLSFLRAPERIIVLDPPRDPVIPSISKLTILMIGLGGGLLMGIGLGLLATFFDRRVRTADRLAQAAGVPVLATLPWLPAAAGRRTLTAGRVEAPV